MSKGSKSRPSNRRILGAFFAACCVAIAAMLIWRPEPMPHPTPECSAEELALASAAGHAAATFVADSTVAGTMQRDNAILSIRSRETRIRRSGYPTAADSFATAAEATLRAKGCL